jgi:uncharacterized membrane protein
MGKGRLEAFSDGVIAILITIMVLELKIPEGGSPQSLRPLLPVLLSYLLSFVYLGIYWNNHHHLLHSVQRLTSGIMWANLHLLFWLSVVPFTTGWMGANRHAAVPAALYGLVLLMAGIAFFVLQWTIIRSQGRDSPLRRAVGRDWKGKLSPLVYAVAIGTAFVSAAGAEALYALVAFTWLVPDPRYAQAQGGG